MGSSRRLGVPVLAMVVGALALPAGAFAAAPTATTGSVTTVSVEGVANVPIAQDANLATATAVYRQGMAEAMTDGQGKAEFLAGNDNHLVAPVHGDVLRSLGADFSHEFAKARFGILQVP